MATAGAGLVDLSLWDSDRAALVAQVAAAAKDTGFLQARACQQARLRRQRRALTRRAQVYNHGVPQEDIDAAFAASASFFALPDEVKARTPFASWAGGWEKEQQARARGACACRRRTPAGARSAAACGLAPSPAR